MAGSRRSWRGALVVLLVAGQVGCAARGRVAGSGAADSWRPGIGAAVSVAAGEGRVRVARDGFAEAWASETGRCTREMALPVGIQTLGLGLLVLPAVCGAMTGAMPGMTTRFSAGRMRRAVEQSIAHRDLHGTLRDAIASAMTDPGHAPDATLEVTLTELRIRDDGTLSSVAARVRLLRAADGTELVTRAFTHEVPRRGPWSFALDSALAALSASIVETMLPTSHPAAAAGLRTGDEP